MNAILSGNWITDAFLCLGPPYNLFSSSASLLGIQFETVERKIRPLLDAILDHDASENLRAGLGSYRPFFLHLCQ